MHILKRAIALALALFIVLMLPAPAAAFTDEAAIVHTDAAVLLSALQIISGFPDGSFRAGSPVTRAQMGKMIYVALRGGQDDKGAAFAGARVPLSDISGHWGSGYIKYAYGLGIVSGFPSGVFLPDTNVTGYQAARMLLTALGYKADLAGYTGTGWDFRVAVDAAGAGLLENLGSVDLSQPLSRDNAALLVFNALFAETVQYAGGTAKRTGVSLALSKFMLKTLSGVLISNDQAGISAAGASRKGTYALIDDDGATVSDIPGDADTALLGQSVTAFVKMKPDRNVIEKTYGKVVATPGKNRVIVSYDAGFDPGDSFDLSAALYSYNYAPAGAKGPDPKKGDRTVYIDHNADRRVDYILAFSRVYGEVTVKATSAGNALRLSGLMAAVSADAVLGADAVASGDKAIGYAILSAGAPCAYAVSKAQSFTGTFTAVTSKNEVRIDGAAYALSAITGVRADLLADISSPEHFGRQLTIYTDGAYIVDFEAAEKGGTLFAGVRACAPASGSGVFAVRARVAVTLSDATEAIFEVGSISGRQISAFEGGTYAERLAAFNAALTECDNKVVSYTLNNGIIELGDPILPAVLSAPYKAGAAVMNTSAGSFVIGEDTVIFSYNASGDDFSVYTGRVNAPNIAAISAIRASDENAVTKTAGVLLATRVNEVPDNSFGLIVDYEIRYSSADRGYYLAVFMCVGTEVRQYTVKTGVGLTGIACDLRAGDLIEFTVNGGKISAFSKQAVNAVLPAAAQINAVYGGYALDYLPGEYLCLRQAGTGSDASPAADLLLSFADGCVITDLGSLDGTCILTGGDPVTAPEDILSAQPGRVNVIIRLDEDANIVAAYYFSETVINTNGN